jgi:hypothetical protein
MDCERFYCERDRRTGEYLGSGVGECPVHVAIDRASARSPTGQLLLLALANQLARVHRRITFDIPMPEVSVAVVTPFEGTALGELTLRTVRSIDPCGSFELSSAPPADAVTLGIGSQVAERLDWYLGAEGAKAYIGRATRPLAAQLGTLRGAALAACLGAAAAFRAQIGRTTTERTVSAWNFGEGPTAEAGPAKLAPVEVGKVLLVGAGAVASSLVYWLRAFGVAGEWTIVDGDQVAVHNLNRGLVFASADAGWPNGLAQFKADILSEWLPRSRPMRLWYDEVRELRDETFDVVLCLANERGVRGRIANRGESLVLHATTGENWMSQLHRHIPGVDDCIACRVWDITSPAFPCSTGTVTPQSERRGDAALPFLSAAAGLMLAVALQRLMDGSLAAGAINDWRWDFDSTHRMASGSVRRCRDGCATLLPAEMRLSLNAKARWIHLDPAYRGGRPADVNRKGEQ